MAVFVRDSLLDLKSKDIDFVSSNDYDTVANLLKENGYSIKEEGKQFLVLIASKDNLQFEIACFRTEDNYSDGRRPDKVNIGDIFSDSQRRDFKVNALYYSLRTETITDLVNGLDDIQNKTLSCIGKPKDRFREDYLRVWRAIRLGNTKGLKIDRKTEKAMREIFQEAYENSNPQRVLSEMMKLQFN